MQINMQGPRMLWKQQREAGEEMGRLGSFLPTVCVSNLDLKAIWALFTWMCPPFCIHSELNLFPWRERHAWGGGGGKRVDTEASAWLGARSTDGRGESHPTQGSPPQEAPRMEPVLPRQRNVSPFEWLHLSLLRKECTNEQDSGSCVLEKAAPWLPWTPKFGSTLGETDTQTLSLSPSLSSEHSVCSLQKKPLSRHSWACLPSVGVSLPWLPHRGQLFLGWGWRTQVVACCDLGWIKCLHQHLDVRLLMPRLGPRCLLLVFYDLPSAHSVPLFSPLVLIFHPSLSQAPCYAIFRKWTSHGDGVSLFHDRRALG